LWPARTGIATALLYCYSIAVLLSQLLYGCRNTGAGRPQNKKIAVLLSHCCIATAIPVRASQFFFRKIYKTVCILKKVF
jgi:hypothetical protein